MDNNNNANLLNITYGPENISSYTKRIWLEMWTVGNTHQSAIEMQVKSKR